MAKSKEPEYDDKEQSKRFVDKAREIKSDESGKNFVRVIKKITPAKKQETKPLSSDG